MVFSSCFIFTTLKCKLLEHKVKVSDFMLACMMVANYPIFGFSFYICKMEGAGHIAIKFLPTPCCMVRGTVTRVINDMCTGKDFNLLLQWKLNCYMATYNIKVTEQMKQILRKPANS